MKILCLLCLSLGFFGFISHENSPNVFTVETAIANPELKEYVGTYTFTGNSPISTFVITVEKDDLYGQADSYGANKLLKQSKPDTFLSTSSYGSTIIFLRDSDTKKITGLELIIQGTTLEATRNKENK